MVELRFEIGQWGYFGVDVDIFCFCDQRIGFRVFQEECLSRNVIVRVGGWERLMEWQGLKEGGENEDEFLVGVFDLFLGIFKFFDDLVLGILIGSY